VSVRSKKKSRWQRGSRTCGWGRVGQHRRSGTRGGRGHAGYHKHMWTWVVKYAPSWFGKRGFVRHPSLVPEAKIINLNEIDERLDEWLKAGYAKIVDDKIEVDLLKLGYNKVLGEGNISRPVVIKALSFTKKAIQKITQAGGQAVKVAE